ncbi:aldehyde dehydrogenase family protein, partial [Streptomyces sp. SID10244]|nr:aldehyde dehydrogenase family protein [Streptomyces sp. SID10244]
MQKRLLIDGQLVTSATTFETINPATGEVLGSAPDAGVDEATAAIAAARTAFEKSGWATDVTLRARCLDQLHKALLAHAEELRDLTIAEVGATKMLTKGNQLDAPIEIVRYYADLLESHSFTEDLGEIEIRGQQHRRWTEREPAGVVAAIIAYNYPNQLALAKLAPSLAAGCTVVLKGAPDTPLVTLALGEIIAEHTDIPAGVVNIITSSKV